MSDRSACTPAAWLARLREGLRASRERRLVWVRGSAAFTRQWADAALAGEREEDILRIGENGIAPAQARQYLGREFAVLVWDARAGLHPDGFGALAGTLRGGGVLLLLTPLAAHWSRFDDPDYGRLASIPAEKRFLDRFARILGAADTVLKVAEDEPLPALVPSEVPPSRPVESVANSTLPTSGQREALAAIVKVRHGHRRRPLVLTADRGRGKTSVLGMAAARLLSEAGPRGDGLRILVTAPRPAALAPLWEHATAALGNVGSAPDFLEVGRSSLRYYPPDALLASNPAADLLLVDEAAAIPVSLLLELLKRYARVVFATTIHGYEGSGRGFALRFRAHLDDLAPGWRELTLTQPVRWAETDLLEPLANRLLLLDAELAEPSPGPVELVPWPGPERAGDERRLTDVFGLLINAHYQTTPDDLRLLLDDPDSHCWLALQQGAVVGAIWIMAETGVPEDLADAVRQGRRRTRGQLLPQALASYGADSAAATRRYWRILRIAVHPQCRRAGLGRRLVETACAAAQTQHCDAIGTSFGATESLVDFWRACGLDALRLGLGRDAASGAHSLIMARGLSGAGQALCDRHRQRFSEHWPGLLAAELNQLEPDLCWTLNRDWCPPAIWREQDALEARDFAEGHRPLALARLSLRRLGWCLGGDCRSLLGSDAALWCRAVIQQQPEAAWQSQGLATGRREGTARLRTAAQKMLAELKHEPEL